MSNITMDTSGLSILNANPRRLPGPSNLHRLVANEGRDGRPAIEYLSSDGEIETLTYQELHRESESLARTLMSWLSSRSSEPNKRLIVPIFMQQCPQLYISQLAILKAGAAFCPISLDVPEERLRFILDDVQASLMLTTNQLQDKLPNLDPVVVLSVDSVQHKSNATALPSSVEPSHPAYIMYTSGSTGQPKGVILSHSAAAQALLAHDQHIPSFSRFLQFAHPTFDVSVFEIFFPLYRGCTLICGDRRKLLNDLPGFINAMNADAAELTPSVTSNLLRGRLETPTLKLLLTIGEMLKRDVIEEYGGSESQQSILYGMYGPTEATIHCTLQPSFDCNMSAGNIGVPLDTVSAFIVKPQTDDDNDLGHVEIMPLGEEGELAVGGYQLADGYLNRTEQTKKAFVSHPKFGNLYRTGDRARLTKEGLLECSGRISSGQVKLRGQRIELGEIEYAASKTSGCQTVVADVISGSLAVFCVITSGSSNETDVQDVCRKWLPGFMVPTDVFILKELPYLDSGKVNRKALQELFMSGRDQVSDHSSADSPRLRTIIDVVSDVLQTKVDSSTRLAAAGMDSLSSIRISAQLKRAGLFQLDATAILESKTAREIDTELQRLESIQDSEVEWNGHSIELSGLRDDLSKNPYIRSNSGDIDHTYPTTPTQSAMLLETARTGQAYCNWIELDIGQPVSVDDVQSSIQQLASLHGLLRSGFVPVDRPDATHAVVTWKDIKASQIKIVKSLDYEFTIADESQLLRPLTFQIKPLQNSIRILLQIHHAQYDQWSMDVLRSDLQDILLDKKPPLRPSFEAVSMFQFSEHHINRKDDDLDFWSDHLRDFSPTPLPSMVGTRVQSALQRTEWRDLAVDLTQIRQKAHDLQYSVPSIFQAAMALLLGSYVGSTDITFGVVFSGRHLSLPGIEGVFGPCLSTLPLRLDSSSTRTCTDLLRLIHNLNRSIQKHSSTPLAHIKGLVNNRDTTLFDTLFVWQESTWSSHDHLSFVREIDSADQHEFNLVLEFKPTEDGVLAKATFQQAIISAEQIGHTITQVGHFVNQIVHDADSLIENLTACLPASSLSIANSTPTDCSSGYSLIDSIERHAITTPAAPALVFADSIRGSNASTQTLTYQELNGRSNRLAHLIHSRYKPSNHLIAIFMEKSPDLYVAILATIKAGCGYLPLIPETPSARVQSILQQAGVDLCICDSVTLGTMASLAGISFLNVSQLNLTKFDWQNLGTHFPDDRIAYTVFTSGSTGVPKGVPITMKNLLGNLQALTELYAVEAGDRLLQACSHAFDVSVFEIFFTFFNGMTLCSATKEVMFQDFEASIRALKITHLSLTPTVAALVDPAAVPSVKFLVTAGEAVTDAVHSRWAGHGLHQGYGPSETTNICSVRMNVTPLHVLGNIGPPFRNTSAFVLSAKPNFEILPLGGVGEFAFGGEQVFHGYVGNEELNAAKIIHHPKYGRIYRSGDVGRILPDGSLLIQGRLDDQVKVRGNRIELGEINAQIMQDDNVQNCVTLVIGQTSSEQAITSFIVCKRLSETQGQDYDESELLQRIVNRIFENLESVLPSYMVPSTISVIEDIPRTSQGKLDQRKLLDWYRTGDSSSIRTFVREHEESNDNVDWSASEIKMAETIAGVLDIDRNHISRRDSFFSMGLNSLNAITIAKRLSKVLNVDLSVATILRNTSVARLSRVLADEKSSITANGHHEALQLLSPRLIDYVYGLELFDVANIASVLPCTPLQEAMLSASEKSTEGAYWNSTALSISGDVAKMKSCWTRMVQRHEILRTRFVGTDDSKRPYVQVVLNETSLPWSSTSSTETTKVTNGDLASKPRNVSRSSPFQIEELTSNDRSQIVLHMHHAIYDGISISQLLQEVEDDFKGTELSPTPSFRKYLEEAEKQNDDDAIAFWSQQLHSFDPHPLPKLFDSRDPRETSTAQQMPVSVAHIEGWCKQHAVSPLSVFQTALAKILALSQGIQDICFGNVVSGRTIPVPEVDRLVAPCFNTVPVRADLSEFETNLQALSYLSGKNVDSLQYQLTPLRRLQILSDNPARHLFDCLLILQHPQRTLDANIWQIEGEAGSMDLPLVLEITPTQNNYDLRIHYSEQYLSDDLTQKFADGFSAAIQSCLRYPHGRIEDFVDQNTAEIDGSLRSHKNHSIHANGKLFIDAVAAPDEERSIRNAFAQLAGLSPDAISRDTSMFRIGLDSLNAPQLAVKLRSLGVGVDAGDVLECLTPVAIATRAQQNQASRPADQVDLDHFDKTHRKTISRHFRNAHQAIESVWPCTPVQCGMLSLTMQSKGDLYINHVTCRVPEQYSVKQIHEAWTRLAMKYQVLRMGFHETHDPQTPFAMIIFKGQSDGVPVNERTEKISIRKAETLAKDQILRNISTRAWCVQIVMQNSERFMVLSMHHSLYDADSLKLLLNGLVTALDSSELGPPSSIAPDLKAILGVSTHDSESSAKFWSTELQGAMVTRFPDLTPTATANQNLEHLDYKLSHTRSTLEAFSRKNNATVQALGQTIWATLLASYSGEDKIIFGTVFSGSPAQSDNPPVFPCITTIPVPCDTACPPVEILHRMVCFNSNAHRHRFTPLAEIQRVAGYDGRSLFDTVFVYQKSQRGPTAFDWPIAAETAAVDYTASLELEVSDDEDIMMRLTFRTNKIPVEHAHLILEQYDHLWKQLVAGQESIPQHLYSVLPAKEPVLPSEVVLLHQFVEKSAELRPDQVALTFVGGNSEIAGFSESWSYKELNNRANQVAHLIQRKGISSENVIAVSMNKCAEASFAFIGILKAGCSFLAIDPDLPKARLEFILQDSDAKLLFVNDSRSISVEYQIECLELTMELLEPLPTEPKSDLNIESNATCYCLYTSGTTGTPKGCEITHENAVQAMLSFQRLFSGHWTKTSRWLQFASYWFDVSVLEQFWSWSVGIEVVGAPRDLVLEDLPGFISTHQITHIDLTPSLARLLHPEDVPSLWNGVFITGGEALKQEIIDAWGPKKTICNGYGPTEATIGVTMNTFIGPDAKPSNIGRQFDNVGALVLKPESDEPVLRGAIGELCVSGKLVGKGYLNRPDLTDTQFPALDRFNERVYRTGDLVRVLADGSFAFAGRKDSQAKLRGQRLEISEIDNVIQHCAESVAHAVSLIVKADDGSKEALISFMTINAQGGAGELELDFTDQSKQLVTTARQACSDQLPGYMVPTHILAINFLPLTVNNKVDNKRLTELFTTSSSKDLQAFLRHEEDSATMSATEKEICSVLSELLHIRPEDISPSSSLFSLGLSSISAISFAGLLKRRGFNNANVATVMSNATVNQLSAALQKDINYAQENKDSIKQAQLSISAFAKKYCGTVARSLQVTTDDIESVTPCTPLQQGLILDSLRSDCRLYFNEFRYEFADVEPGRLRKSIDKLVQHAQILRAQFVNTGDGVAQAILKRRPGLISMASMPNHGRRSARVSKLRQEWIDQNQEALNRPFEAHIICGSDMSLLIFHIHHALYDGISYQLLTDCLQELYFGQTLTMSGPSFITALPHGPLQQVKSSRSFWQQRLHGFRPTPLPRAGGDGSGQDHVLHFLVTDTTLIEDVRKAMGVSHQSLMQSCFEIALRQYAPSIQIYGVVVSGRSIELAGADQILGPMFNTLPQPLSRDRGLTLRDYIRSCHNANIELLPLQHTPLRDIRRWMGGGHAHSSMFDVLFVFQHKPGEMQQRQSHLLHETEPPPQAQYPLSCEVELSDDGEISISLVAQDAFLGETDIQNLCDRMKDVLECVLQHPDASLEEKFGIEIESRTPASQENGSTKPYVNGVLNFEWSQEATVILSEVAELTGLDSAEIDEHSSLFTLGLDSIDAVKLATRLRKNGLSIPVSKILQAQTIPRMLKGIQVDGCAKSPNHGKSTVTQIQDQLQRSGLALPMSLKASIETILPATPTQEGLLADMYKSELREYFNHDVLRLQPGTDLDRLKRAWQTVIDNTPILRTIFVEVTDPDIDAVFAQVTLQSKPLTFKQLAVDEDEDFNAVIDSIRAETVEDIRSEPPLRLSMVTNKANTYLILSISHAQYDGHSLALLHEDVNRAYRDSFKPRPSYKDAIEASLNAVSADAQHFWTDTLSEAVPCSFPRLGIEDQATKTYRTENRTQVSSPSARSFCKEHGISMQALAQTCWALTLAHYTRSMDVMFGVVLACRDSKEAEEVMFPTMNTVVMRASVHGSRADMTQHVQSLVTDMLPYQRTPLRTIQAAASRVNGPSSALFDTLFIYQHRPDSDEDAGPPLYESVGGDSSVDYPVAVEIEAVDDDTLIIRGACKGSVLDQEGADQLLETVNDVLSAIIQSPDEASVEFDGSDVSICGMESFRLNDEDTEFEEGFESNEVQIESSPLAASIMDALAQVAKISTEDITTSTTIESIGIDSISAIKVASLLRKQGIDLSVSELLKTKTPARMANALQEKSGPASAASRTQPSSEIISKTLKPYMDRNLLREHGIDTEDMETVLPATAGQIYMLSMWQKTGGQIFYPTFQYRLQADVKIEDINYAWSSLTAHHPILRTVFCSTGDRSIPALQVVMRKGQCSFQVGQSTTSRQKRQPVVSLQAEKVSDGYELNLSIHHALYDAVSLPLIIQDLQSLLAKGTPSHTKVKFEDFAALSISHRSKQLQKHFWSEYLDEVEALQLTQPEVDGPQKKVEIFHPALFNEATAVERIARKESVSMQAILFAAYAKVYSSLTTASASEAEDVILGIYLSNRSHIPGLETLAAPALNLVPLLVRSPQKTNLLELARQVQKDLQKIGTAENSAAGLWEIEQWTGIKVDTFVNFLKLPDVQEADPGEEGVVIQAMDDRRFEERSGIVEPEDGSGFELPKELEGMKGVDAYQHSLDIEMTVTDGRLDVGLFCPESMVSLQPAEEALKELKAFLEKFVGKAKE